MLLMILLLIFLTNGMSILINEECLSNNIKKYEIGKEVVVPITTYLTDEYTILFQMSFEDRMESLDMDYIKVKPNSYEITRERSGVTSIDRFNTSIPFGWVNMNISVNKHVVNINPYISNITSEYPMQYLSIASQYLSSCEQGTPAWKVSRDMAISVPLNGEGRHQISFTSESDFSAFITIIGSKYYLTNESGITLGSSGSKLSANTYNFIIENGNNYLKLLYKNEECDLQILSSLKLRTLLWNITVGTLDEDFTVVLKPMFHHSNSCESSLMDRSSVREDGPRGNTGLLITTLIFGFLFITTVTVLMLRVNSPKYAPLFDFLQIKKNTNEGNKDIKESVCSGLNETKIQLQEKLPLTAIANNEVQHMLETRKPETDKFQKQLEEENTESDELRQQLQDKTTETDQLRQQVIKGEAFRILHVIKKKDNLSDNIPIPDYVNAVRDELIGKIFVNGQDVLNVFLSIMEMFPDDNLVQSVGMHIIIHMKDNFKMVDKDIGAVEADNDSIGIILRKASLTEKFWERAVLSAIHTIGNNKNSNVLNECLKLLYYSCTKDNIKQKEDMIDECVGVVLKVFEDIHSTDINKNSSLFLRDVNNIEYSKSSAQVVRIANAAAVHIEKNHNPEVVSNCLRILLILFSKANPNHKEDMVNSHLVKVILTLLKTKLKSCIIELPDVDDEHKTGWEILSKAIYQSKTNLAKFGAKELFDLVLQYLQIFQVGAKSTETVLGISLSIIIYPDFKANFIRYDFMKIIYGILDDKEAKHNWVRTFAAELICRLAEDSTSAFYLMKNKSSKLFPENLCNRYLKKLIECMEKNRLQLCAKVDPEKIELWKMIVNPQPEHFEAIRNYLVL